MGSFDGAEACELVGLYLLHQLNQKFPTINFGLYRDDGLGSYNDIPGPSRDKIRKEIIKLFKDNGLTITIDMNLTIATSSTAPSIWRKEPFTNIRKITTVYYISTKNPTTRQT